MENEGARQAVREREQAAWFCAYTPVEVLSAAGLEPVRLFGSQGNTDSADSILGTNICPYVSACLEQGLGGSAPRAVVFAGCCDSMRRLSDAWSYYCGPEFAHIMDVPRSGNGVSLELYRAAIEDLIRALEEYRGRAITSQALASAILKRSRADAGLARISAEPHRSAEEYLDAFTEAQSITPEKFVQKVGERLRSCYPAGQSGTRKAVIVTGNLIRPGTVLEVIDDCGAAVVSLDLCSAERYVTWDAEVPLEAVQNATRDELVEEVARRYMSRTPCPRMLNKADRHERIAADAVRLGASGVVIVPLMFCDPFLYDLPSLEKHLYDAGIPSLVLQSDYQDASVGQLTTRVEAFMEMI